MRIKKIQENWEQQIYSDEPQMESPEHYYQLHSLFGCLNYHWRNRKDFFIGANLSVYYNKENPKKRAFIGPDFFFVNTPNHKTKRKSWMVWLEGKFPDVVIELLSDETKKNDKEGKFQLYEQEWKLPEYYWYSPDNHEFAGFHLINNHYEPIEQQQVGAFKDLLWSQQMNIYLGVHNAELRCFDAQGLLILKPDEDAIFANNRIGQEKEITELANQRAEKERLRAENEKEQTQFANQRAERAIQQLERANQTTEQAIQQLVQANQTAEQAIQQLVQANQTTEQAIQQLEQEKSRADKLTEKLKKLGINPNTI